MRVAPVAAFALVLAGLACSPASTPSEEGGSQAPSRVLIMVTRYEPATLSMKEIPLTQGAGDGPARAPFNAGLASVDSRSITQPFLATTLPQLNTDAWKVFPDGRMETTYRLRRTAWHDGTPLTAADFVFSWRVYATPEFGHTRLAPSSEVEEIVAPEPDQVVIRWRRPFPDANNLDASLLPPLPAHILEEPYGRMPPEAFSGHPYWKTEYVGLGAYRVQHWEPGSFVEGVAFPDYVLGRPRIERIRLRFVPDSNTVLANLLAGEAHLTYPFTLNPEQTTVLRAQWAGVVLVNATSWRRVEVQHRPDYVNPRVLQEERIRRALAHAIDRETLNEVIYAGESIVMDTPIPPMLSFYPAVQRAIAHYSFDVRRSQQLLAEAGLIRGADDFWASPTEGRLTFEVKANATASFQNELAIIASGFRAAGLETKETHVPVALIRDGETRGSFPGLYVIQGGEGEGALRTYHSRAMSRPENGWVGSNRGGYASPTFDRLMDALSTTLEQTERERLLIEAARAFSEDVPAISLIFGPSVVAADNALRGPVVWGYGGDVTWNLHEWEWR